ncbi:carbohydrate ABC transporter permease [Planotetraspora sp. GP83]|uniref:carbohydrate ABC transporter permease n=1 Tax=Planotetraspora sp. GP83 TaxID=3156264 RepID=UPI0035163B5B
MRRSLTWVAVHSLAIALALMFLAPLVFLFLASAMSDEQTLGPALWPRSWHFENYAEVFAKDDFVTWWRNTLIYAFGATAAMLVSSVPVAYAMARFRFCGERVAMLLLVAGMMLPPQVTIVPLYLVWAQQLHLNGTLWPLILPLLFGDAFSIFLLRQFLMTIPQEYFDAAKVDGCGELRTVFRVVLPMARPAIAAVALFQFFFAWNDYFGPQIYTSENPGAWTLAYGLAGFNSAHSVHWNQTIAATLLVMAPVIVVFFFAQRVFVQGVTLTGVKG